MREKGPRPEGAPSCTLNDSERLGYDAVNLPDHYRHFKIEPIRFCQENSLDFLTANIVKYIVRDKNGVEDLYKAARCLEMRIARDLGDPDWWKVVEDRASKRNFLTDRR